MKIVAPEELFARSEIMEASKKDPRWCDLALSDSTEGDGAKRLPAS